MDGTLAWDKNSSGQCGGCTGILLQLMKPFSALVLPATGHCLQHSSPSYPRTPAVLVSTSFRLGARLGTDHTVLGVPRAT